MATWTKQKLGDVLTLHYGKGLPEARREFGNYSVYGSSGVVGSHNVFLVNGPGIILGRKGSVGEVYFSRNNFFPIDTVYFIEEDKSKYDLYFIFNLLKDLNLKRLQSDTGVPGLKREAVYRENIFLPDFSTQKHIASVLSAYDDLIENNEKRIKVLEEMAQRLYTEWFVKLKFPGHEKVNMVDSGTEFGKIPEGWEVKNVGECFELLGGGTPPRAESKYWNGTINWYTPTDLTGASQMFSDASSEQITELGLKNSSAKLFPPYSVMMTSRATIGVVSINTNHSATNQGFIVCIPNAHTPLYYLYFWLKAHVKLFIDLGSGATFKEISKSNFKKIKILLPRSDVLENFEKMLKTIGDSVLFLQRKNQNLAKTRDLLIPQLVTGKRELMI